MGQADFQKRGEHANVITVASELGEPLSRLANGPSQGINEQLVFAAEVVVHDSRRDPGLDGDIAHSHSLGAISHEHACRCGHELLAAIEGVLCGKIQRNRHRHVTQGHTV